MADPFPSVLAANATVEWVWSAAWLLLLSGAVWLGKGDGDGQPGDDRPADGPAPQRAAEDAIRIRELEATIDELTRLRSATLDASQRRDEFLATLSHELRGPLNAILGWTQVLQPRPDLPDDVRDALAVIRRNALRQRQLLDDLVDTARVVSSALRIEPRPMRVQEAIDDACQAAGPEMQRKGIRLDCGSPTEAVVSGDGPHLQQMLRNLLSNAIRFTPAGGAVSIRTSTLASDVWVAISDTGAGVEADVLPHVFEFQPQSGAESRDQATLRLGLALARLIVAGHGGRVVAHSDGPGRGSTFTVILPTLTVEQDATAPMSADVSDATAGAPLGGVRVLAVDDEPDWRELLAHILAAAGADARIAASAAEAIQVFEGWRPDVVVTDIAMPVTDGYGLLASIRGRGGAGRAVPAIAMTAHAGAQERTRSARAGFAEHLAKPIPPHELIDAVRRVADSSPRAKGVGGV
jgi:signal transduction histidine kinase/ActR/RegA family two-component response regulator